MRNGGIQIRVSDMLFILRKRWKTIAGLTLLGLLFGLALSGMTYVQTSFQTFEITGSFAITTQNEEGRYINGSLAATNNDFHLAEDMVDAVRYVILSEKVLIHSVEPFIGSETGMITAAQFSECLVIGEAESEQKYAIVYYLKDGSVGLVPMTSLGNGNG